ncbi:MAG: cation-translocating P-type ATPase [Anaerolineaceae bacterium]|nr:cation-translocating P-type ATPase [Anaerolineaceae bacterium]
MAEVSQTKWYNLSPEKALEKIKSSSEYGLSTIEVTRRLEEYGPNQLTEKRPPTFFEMLLEQFNDFLVIMLIVAAIVSAVLGEYIEAGAIMAIVILNAVLGVIQEGRAAQALAALKKMTAPESQVLRDGKRVTIPATELVPGDIVFLEAGNFVPADLRLIDAMNLRVEEASLTGEAHDVTKEAERIIEGEPTIGDRTNCCFMGTTVTYGRGRGLVIGTGMNTELGKIADMLSSVEDEETPLQKNLDKLGKQLGIASLVIVGLVFVIGFVRLGLNNGFGELFTSTRGIGEITELFMVAVGLAIAAVPEGLPAVVTIALALGMGEMVKKHALIRKLASVETLGSATIICSDKTGTLTQNQMTTVEIWGDGTAFEITGSGYEPDGEFRVNEELINPNDYAALSTSLWVGLLNNDSLMDTDLDDNGNTIHRIIGDPTEGAMVVAAAKAGALRENADDAYPRVQEIPFDSTRKRMTTIHSIIDPDGLTISPVKKGAFTGDYAIAVKGAPDIILTDCSYYLGNDFQIRKLTDEKRSEILAAIDEMTKKALRVLGFATKVQDNLPNEIKPETIEKELVFCGLQGMIDPARIEVKPALLEAAKAGIRTIMITGDYPNTAKAIAEKIDLLAKGHSVHTGAELSNMSSEELRDAVNTTDVFARVSPEHKMLIVEALRSNHEVVAMTGDGVNDAPAIKRADIGVAMGITGTDVAKETADMVLTDDNYASIVSAIEQGRVIYSNIRKFVYFLISCNMAEIMVLFLATSFGWATPLNPLQLLWLNLLTDGAPALALATEKGDPDIMDQKPRPTDEPIINGRMVTGVIIQTIAITSVVLVAFFLGFHSPGDSIAQVWKNLVEAGRLPFEELSKTMQGHLMLAQTFAFITLSTSELFRAFTSRSELYPLIKIGFFTNKWMNNAILFSFALIAAVLYIPGLNRDIFHVEPLTVIQWLEILPLLLIPAVVAEVTKSIMTKRQQAVK